MAIWRMDSVEIYGNDMKSLLILRELIDSKKDAKIICSPKFNFDISYKYKEHLFDCGYHAIEVERSPYLWKIISNYGPEFNYMNAKRKLYIDGNIFERNFSLFEMADKKLKKLYQQNKRDAFNFYKAFYIEKQFIDSFEQNKLLRDKFKLPEEQYLLGIDPWFYPREFLEFSSSKIKYHFRDMGNCDRRLAYPREGGFGAIQESLRTSLRDFIYHKNPNLMVLKSWEEIKKTHEKAKIDKVHRVIPVDIISLLNEQSNFLEIKETKYLIIDIELSKDVNLTFTELLVADPNVNIDRLSSNSTLRGEKYSRFFQIEKEVSSNSIIEDEIQQSIYDSELLMDKFANKIRVKNFQYKCFPFLRFDNDKCNSIVINFIKNVEENFENITILNRSLLNRNIVDTHNDLKTAICRREVQ